MKPGDWIVVADFDNRTGESVLDGTLRAAVDRELEYSDFVRVAQRDRIEDALKLLERPLDSRLTEILRCNSRGATAEFAASSAAQSPKPTAGTR